MEQCIILTVSLACNFFRSAAASFSFAFAAALNFFWNFSFGDVIFLSLYFIILSSSSSFHAISAVCSNSIAATARMDDTCGNQKATAGFCEMAAEYQIQMRK